MVTVTQESAFQGFCAASIQLNLDSQAGGGPDNRPGGLAPRATLAVPLGMKLNIWIVTILNGLLFGIPFLLWTSPVQPHRTQDTHPASFLKNLLHSACHPSSFSPTFFERLIIQWGKVRCRQQRAI